MLSSIYPVISWIVISALLAFIALLILRLIFSFTDPNPFGSIGKLSFQIRKITERFVYPAARLLAQFRIDTRYAPLVTILVAAVLTYFGLQIIGNAFFIAEGLITSIAAGDFKAVVGYLLYAVLSIYILLIFIRFISTWFVF